MKFNLSFSFMGRVFDIVARNSLPNPGSQRFSFYVFFLLEGIVILAAFWESLLYMLQIQWSDHVSTPYRQSV